MGVKGTKLVFWTARELRLLEKYCSKGMAYLMKVLPNRTEQAIRVKCCYMGLTIGDSTTQEVIERLYMVV